MDIEQIKKILDDESLTERFVEVFVDEINKDDEIIYKKGIQLLNLCLDDDKADNFFIAACGWNVDSLIRKMYKDDNNRTTEGHTGARGCAL